MTGRRDVEETRKAKTKLARSAPAVDSGAGIRLGLQDERFDIPSLAELNADDERIARLFPDEKNDR
jgi:hypothetical protein